MREILFRGKRVGNGEWIYGSYVQQYGATMIYLPDGVDSEHGFDNHHVDPATVGQFTGLTNENGVKIFEGDILESVEDYDDKFGYPATNYFYSVVIWDEENFCWAFKTGEYVQAFNDWDWDNSIKVGNIHDNPELLTGGTK